MAMKMTRPIMQKQETGRPFKSTCNGYHQLVSAEMEIVVAQTKRTIKIMKRNIIITHTYLTMPLES